MEQVSGFYIYLKEPVAAAQWSFQPYQSSRTWMKERRLSKHVKSTSQRCSDVSSAAATNRQQITSWILFFSEGFKIIWSHWITKDIFQPLITDFMATRRHLNVSLITFKVNIPNLFHFKCSSGFTSRPVWCQVVQNDCMTGKPPIVTSSDIDNVPARQNRKFGRESKVMSWKISCRDLILRSTVVVCRFVVQSFTTLKLL